MELNFNENHQINLQEALKLVQNNEAELLHIVQSGLKSYHTNVKKSDEYIQMSLDNFERLLPQHIVQIPKEESQNDDNFLSSSSSSGIDFSKALMVFTFLNDEVNELKEIADKTIYGNIEIFGQFNLNCKIGHEEEYKDGEYELMIGEFLTLLQNVINFCNRCNIIVLNIVQQLCNCSEIDSLIDSNLFKRGGFDPLLNLLCDIFGILIRIDTLIKSNMTLQDCWKYYKMTITYARNSPELFNIKEDLLTRFEEMLVIMDTKLFTTELFRSCIEQDFENIFDKELEIQIASTNNSNLETNISVIGNVSFLSRIELYIKKKIEKIMQVINTSREYNERIEMVGIYGLYVLYRRLLPSSTIPNASLYKMLWSVQKQTPFVVVGMKTVWNLSDFLMTEAPLDDPKIDPLSPLQNIQNYMDTFASEFDMKSKNMCNLATQWSIICHEQIESCINNNNNNSDFDNNSLESKFESYAQIIYSGFLLIHRMSNFIKYCLSTHLITSRPLSKSLINSLCLLFETIQYLKDDFKKYEKVMAESMNLVQRNLSKRILSIIAEFRKIISSTFNTKHTSQIYLSICIDTIENLLNGSDRVGSTRISCLTLLSHILIVVAKTSNDETSKLIMLSKEKLSKLAKFVQQMELMYVYNHHFHNIYKLDYLYFHLGLLQPCIDTLIIDSKSVIQNSRRLECIIKSFCNSIEVIPYYIDSTSMMDDNNNNTNIITKFIMRLREFILETIRHVIILPLCKSIENELRLHSHMSELSSQVDSNVINDTNDPILNWLITNTLHILGHELSIHDEVEHYLDTTFYDLTTIALHDWNIYSEMRLLAKEKFNLDLMENFLPMGSSLNQGLDVLQIMRNIHIFVARFTYNLNSQEFVEFKPDQTKHVNTIKAENIAASIKQHGLGILNTTVNFTYQYLAKKIEQFSQFLNDEYIKAYLSKERRWYKKHKTDKNINSMYPYERAKKFVKDIRKLGLSPNGKSYLDMFRILIMEIGNALGYVRMVGSASMIFCSEAVKFIPDLEKESNFGKHSQTTDDTTWKGFNNETFRSGENLDNIINTLMKHFTEGNDFFKVLVRVFQDVLHKSDHLKDFYNIIPALTISWLDSSLTAKDNMYKISNKTGQQKEMYYADDGFAMGCAYFLAILKQNSKFDSLHWQNSVKNYHISEQLRIDRDLQAYQEKVVERKKSKKKSIFQTFFGDSKKDDENDEIRIESDYDAVLDIGARQLEVQRRDMEHLFFSIEGASIFFRI